jgi:hypothetical protein
MIRSTNREVTKDAGESQLVGTKPINAVANLREQCFAIDAAPRGGALPAACTGASREAAAGAARAVFGQLVEGDIKFLNVVEDVAPSAEEATAGLAGFDVVTDQIHGATLVSW